MSETLSRLSSAVVSAFPKTKRTSIWLLKIIIPISFIVSLLHYFGVIDLFSVYLKPLFSLVGLPGEAAIVFLTSIFLSLYAPIAIIATLPLDAREITILAVMCLIAHNLPVETAVQSKTGSSYIGMFTLRIVSAFVAAYFLNLLLPHDITGTAVAGNEVVYSTFWEMLKDWGISTFWLVIKVILIISGLMILQNILKEFKVLDIISKSLSPFMSVMGLPKSTSFLWFVAHILGLTYGSAVMIEEVENNELSREDANLLNHHIAVNHSSLEDVLLFVAIGVNAAWLIIPRFILAISIVWFVRLWNQLFHRKSQSLAG